MCKTKRFGSPKNRFHTFSTVNHDVFLSLFILIWLSALRGVKSILQGRKSLCLLREMTSLSYEIHPCWAQPILTTLATSRNMGIPLFFSSKCKDLWRWVLRYLAQQGLIMKQFKTRPCNMHSSVDLRWNHGFEFRITASNLESRPNVISCSIESKVPFWWLST